MVDFLLFLTYSEIMGLWAFSHTFPSAKKALSLQLLIAVPRHSDLCTDITSSEKDVPKRFLYPPSLTLLNFLHDIYYYRNYLFFFLVCFPYWNGGFISMWTLNILLLYSLTLQVSNRISYIVSIQ